MQEAIDDNVSLDIAENNSYWPNNADQDIRGRIVRLLLQINSETRQLTRTRFPLVIYRSMYRFTAESMSLRHPIYLHPKLDLVAINFLLVINFDIQSAFRDTIL